jgi:hypothetical protein
VRSSRDQNAQIALLNGQIQLIDTNTKVIQGEQQQQIQFYLANTTRDATIITQNAAANGTSVLAVLPVDLHCVADGWLDGQSPEFGWTLTQTH